MGIPPRREFFARLFYTLPFAYQAESIYKQTIREQLFFEILEAYLATTSAHLKFLREGDTPPKEMEALIKVQQGIDYLIGSHKLHFKFNANARNLELIADDRIYLGDKDIDGVDRVGYSLGAEQYALMKRPALSFSAQEQRMADDFQIAVLEAIASTSRRNGEKDEDWVTRQEMSILKYERQKKKIEGVLDRLTS